MQNQHPSPLEKLNLFGCKQLYIKRDDEIHPLVSGNKWRKLQGHLEGKSFSRIVTLGGPFSNHLHAVAAYAFHQQLPSLGFVRGEVREDNPTIKDIRKWGMELINVSREQFRHLRKNDFNDIENYLDSGDLIIPEGGKGKKGLIGFHSVAKEVLNQSDVYFQVEHILAAVGTGTTVAGLARSFPTVQVWAVMAVRDPSVKEEVRALLTPEEFSRIRWVEQFTFKGFARVNDKLIEFVKMIEMECGIPLDYIYTAKAMWALRALLRDGILSKQDQILFYHSGGLQGNRGILQKRG